MPWRRRCGATALCVAWLACACDHRDAGIDVDARRFEGSARRFDNDRLPVVEGVVPGNTADGFDPAEPVRRRNGDGSLEVVGDGAFADALAVRAIAMLPEGWRAEVRVVPGCDAADCLHWTASSADGLQRVEWLPVERSTQTHATTPDIVHLEEDHARSRAGAVKESRFPGADAGEYQFVESADHYPPRGGSTVVRLRFDHGQASTVMRTVVEATVEDDTVAVHGSGTERSEPEPMGIATRALRTSLRILDAPRDQFDADALLRVADGFRVMPEGWDASRLQCQSRIQVTCTQQSLESARICRLAYCEQVAGFWVMKVREDNRD